MRKPTLNIEFRIWWQRSINKPVPSKHNMIEFFSKKNNPILFILKFWLFGFFSGSYSLKKTMKQIFARILCAKHLWVPMKKCEFCGQILDEINAKSTAPQFDRQSYSCAIIYVASWLCENYPQKKQQTAGPWKLIGLEDSYSFWNGSFFRGHVNIGGAIGFREDKTKTNKTT